MRFKDRLASLGFATYEDYLRSQHWQDFRQRYRKSGRPTACQACGVRPVCLHHTTYVRLGAETFDDITPLCRECHHTVHEILKHAGRPVEMTPWALEALCAIIGCLAAASQPNRLSPRRKRRKSKAEKRAARQAKVRQKNSPVSCAQAETPQRKERRERQEACLAQASLYREAKVLRRLCREHTWPIAKAELLKPANRHVLQDYVAALRKRPQAQNLPAVIPMVIQRASDSLCPSNHRPAMPDPAGERLRNRDKLRLLRSRVPTRQPQTGNVSRRPRGVPSAPLPGQTS